MTEIVAVHGREILDSRGNPTVEVELATVSGFVGRASVPSGASTGQNEAVELRDGEGDRYGGKGVTNAALNVETELAQVVIGLDAADQRTLDLTMLEADGTENKERLGANAILGVSLAAAKAAAEAAALPLVSLPRRGGGVHPPRSLREHNERGRPRRQQRGLPGVHGRAHRFRYLPEALRSVAEVYQGLKKLLAERGLSGGIGDEGGFAPDLESNGAALGLIAEAIERSGYSLGDQLAFALDPAASEFYEDGEYDLAGEGKKLSQEEMVDYYVGLCDEYPILSIEDGLAEDDWEGWAMITEKLGDRVQLVGDDLFVTNPRILGVASRRASATPSSSRSTRSARSPRRSRPWSWPTSRVHDHDQPPQRRDGGRDDLRPRRGRERRADKDRGAGPRRARGQVQPAPPHRGSPRRDGLLPGPGGFQP